MSEIRIQQEVGKSLNVARYACTGSRDRDLADQRNLTIVPHLWTSGISIAAAAHLAATTPNCAFIEFLPSELCESALRKHLVTDELRIVDGVVPLPTRPGLGVKLNREALERFQRAAERASPALLAC